MSLGIHRHTLDFDVIGGHNIKTFLLADESDYMETPQNPVYEIIVPGFATAVRLSYIPGQVLVINSKLLQLSQPGASQFQDLPDGIYQLTQKIDISQADSLTRYRSYLRTNQLESKYDRLLQRLELSDYGIGIGIGIKNDRQLKESIISLDMLLQSARAEVFLCNDQKAISKYRLADRLADKLLNTLKYK